MGCRNGQKKAETATLKKCRDRSFTWCAETGKMAFCIFLCRNGVIPRQASKPNFPIAPRIQAPLVAFAIHKEPTDTRFIAEVVIIVILPKT